MLKFCPKIWEENIPIFDSEDLYMDILKIGKFINEQGKNKDKDLTEWRHQKKGVYKLNNTELNIIESIEDKRLELMVKNFINEYNYINFNINRTRYDFFTNKLIYNYSIYETPENTKTTLKMFCHIVYLINEITNILNNLRPKDNICKDDIIIDLKTYYISFYTNNYNTFKTKTIILLYNIMNHCFYNGVNYFIDKKGNIIYFTQYISSIAFFELYPAIKRLQTNGYKTSFIKQCEVCKMLFYANNKGQKYCGSKNCKDKKNVEYSIKSRNKKKKNQS